jgi:endonuclease/exonuclease/phosphatase family metal-dependent hydrolase
VDVDSKRCAYVNQVQWLLDHTNLSYGVYASQWKADFIPSDGLGRMNSGNAVLSRWKFSFAERIALPLVSEQDDLTRYFYLQRNILKTKIQFASGRELYLLNLHAEAYAHDGTKKRQIDRFKSELDSLASHSFTFIAGGDFNCIPPESQKVKDFPDSKCTNEEFQADDFSAETDYLSPLFQAYQAEIPLARYQADNSRYFSHTTDKSGFWNRKLDQLFTNGNFVTGSGVVHQDIIQGGMETMPLSDHAPITVKFKFN